MAVPMLGPYGASKFALEGMADALRIELAPSGIQVSIVEPGAIATPFFEKGARYADAFGEHAPEGAKALYGSSMEAVRAAAAELERTAIPPDEAARTIERALTEKRPRTRYLVGLDARIQALVARWLPDRWKDALLRRMIRYPTEH